MQVIIKIEVSHDFFGSLLAKLRSANTVLGPIYACSLFFPRYLEYYNLVHYLVFLEIKTNNLFTGGLG